MAITPMDPLILDEMYEHPERFGHLDKTEYFRLLIEDIRFWREQGDHPALVQTCKNAEVFGTAYLQVRRNELGFEFIPLPPEQVTVSVQT